MDLPTITANLVETNADIIFAKTRFDAAKTTRNTLITEDFDRDNASTAERMHHD